MRTKNFWMIVLLAIFVATLFYDCGTVGPTEPPPPPPPGKTYTLQVQYIRPTFNPQGTMGVDLVLFDLLLNPSSFSLSKIDDFHFKGERGGIKAGTYFFSCMDYNRYDGSDESSVMVGDIIIVTVKETGAAYELKDIRQYTLSTNPHPGPKAKAAYLQLTSDGVIISNP